MMETPSEHPPHAPPPMFAAAATPWDPPVSRRGHSRHSSSSSVPAYVPVNTGRRGSAKDPDALQAALERNRNRKRRTNSTASARLPDDDDEHDDSTSVQRQRQEDARLIRCDAEQQRRNELGKGYDRLRAALNRGDERLSKARVVERATARVVQLRDQNARIEEDLARKQDLIRELNRANEQLMLEASGAAPLLASSPHSASSSSGRPGSSSHTSVSAFGVGQPAHSHDRASSLPTPPHTYTGLQHAADPGGEFGLAPSLYSSKQDTFAYAPFEGAPFEGASAGADSQLFPAPPNEFYTAQLDAPPVIGINPLQSRSQSPQSYQAHAFGLPPGGGAGDDHAHWLPVHAHSHSPTDRVSRWNASSGLPGTFPTTHAFTSSPTREALAELSEVPASGYPPW